MIFSYNEGFGTLYYSYDQWKNDGYKFFIHGKINVISTYDKNIQLFVKNITGVSEN